MGVSYSRMFPKFDDKWTPELGLLTAVGWNECTCGIDTFTDVSEIWRQVDTGIRLAHCSSLEWVQVRHWYQDLTSYKRTFSNESCGMLALQNVILRYVLHVRIVACRRLCETRWSAEYEVDVVTLNTAARCSAVMRCGMATTAGEES
jgi:hypothetical protein